MSSFNDQLRQAAGKPVDARAPERPVGSIGIGRGGAARERGRQPPSMSALIRAARELRREELYSRARSYEQRVADG